jgi:hypothetical protein
VLSLPRQVRFLLARDADLLGQVVGVFLHKVFAWQRAPRSPEYRELGAGARDLERPAHSPLVPNQGAVL